jgi:hypothetical protein
MHGGKTPSGYGLPQTKSGKYSKVLPLRLAARYEESLAHQDLLSVRDDVAVCEARLAELLTRIDTGESAQRWQDLRQALTEFSTALAAGDGAALHRHCATLHLLVRQGGDEYAAWREIQRLWDTRCRLTLTEHKTLVAAQQMVSTEQLLVYMGVITHAIQQAVASHAEPSVARRILGDLSQEFSRIGLSAGGAEA